MASFLLPETMGLAGEGLLGWNKLEDKLATKISQLTGLLHHFSAYPPEAEISEANSEELASQRESEIHEILIETASRIREFKSSLQIQADDNRFHGAVEALRSEHEAIQRATQTELKQSITVAKQLEETMKDGEQALQESMKTQAESFSREMMLLRSDLRTKVEELEKAKLATKKVIQEVDELKNCHHREMEKEKEQCVKVQQYLAVATQQEADLRAREIELQEHVESQCAVHSQAVKEMKALQKVEIEQLKLESFVELEKLSLDCAAREADWHTERLEFQEQLAVTAQEHMQVNLLAQTQIQEYSLALKAVGESFAKEKESTSDLQTALKQTEEENQFMKETLTTASIKMNNLSIALRTTKQEAADSKIAYNSVISKWESVAVQLREDLANVTSTCTANENDIKGYQLKVDELAFQLVTTRKELNLTKIELEQLHVEMQKLNLEIDSKEQDIRRIEGDAETRIRALTMEISRLQLECMAQNENSVEQMKELMEMRIQQQLRAHESDLQILQTNFISELEESRKGNKLKLETMEGKLLKQREEKARAKNACEEFAKALKSVQQKLEEQESKSLSQMLTYDAKVVALMEKLDSLESTGSALEEEFGSLSKQALRYSKQSKQVGSVQQKALRESDEKCVSLETALADLTREHTGSLVQHTDVVELLKKAMAQQQQAHNDTLSSASESFSTQIQQCMDDMQRLKDEHRLATAHILLAHEMELGKLRSAIEVQKNAEIGKERAKLDSCLQRNKLELSEEMELMKLEFEKTLREQTIALDEIQKKHDRLARTHLAVMKDQKEASEAELESCQQANAQALTTCRKKFTQELEKLEENRVRQCERLEQNNLKELQGMHLTHLEKLSKSEENWKQKIEILEKEWKCRLENEEVLWRIERDSDMEELRKSFLFFSTEEKNLLVAGHKIKVCKLDNRISELETLLAQKEERIRRLFQDIARMDESSKMLVLDLKTKHKGELCDMLEKQRIELSQVQREGAGLVEDLQVKHRMELDSSHMDLQKTKVQMMEKQVDLEKKLEKLQERFVNRESRVEDVARISKLELTCEQRDVTITKLNGRKSQLQLELYNREETYNKIFGNSPPPILQQGISDWLKPKQKLDTLKVENSKPGGITKVDRNGKVDGAKVAMLQKRAASATRQAPKAPDNNTRSASTLV